MTETRLSALEQGMGSVDNVLAHLGNLPKTDEDMATALQQLHVGIVELRSCVGGSQMIAAIMAAFQNETMRTSGYLWSTDEKGELNRTYMSDTKARNAIADLMGVK
jgi:hypothetical protein